MSPTDIDLWIKGLSFVIGLGTAAFAAASYHRNSLTKRAEFVLSLHKSFFIDETYKKYRELLDCNGHKENEELRAAVAEESAEFTNFLNFFELIAYLVESETLKTTDAEALLGYYFDLLRRKRAVWEYIAKSSNGFECLQHLLADRSLE